MEQAIPSALRFLGKTFFVLPVISFMLFK